MRRLPAGAPVHARHGLIALFLAAMGLVASPARAGDPPTIPGCEPAPEVCDGIDNDCDGIVDNGNPGGAVPCSTGLAGACNAGTRTCIDGVLECVPELIPHQMPETCDGIDNDCDGIVDNLEGAGEFCVIGVGACQGGGWLGCDKSGKWVCHAELAEPSPEVCDGVDNDCDGAIDEDALGTGEPCETGLPGICSRGLTKCGTLGLLCGIVTYPGSTAEICGDGLDNDCDGIADDGCPGWPNGGQGQLGAGSSPPPRIGHGRDGRSARRRDSQRLLRPDKDGWRRPERLRVANGDDCRPWHHARAAETKGQEVIRRSKTEQNEGAP